MNFSEAQQDMRRAYYDGATGVMVSATVWLIAAMVAWQSTPGKAIAALLIGGMFIFPLSVALSKLGTFCRRDSLGCAENARIGWSTRRGVD
jgi:hypothetical protein